MYPNLKHFFLNISHEFESEVLSFSDIFKAKSNLIALIYDTLMFNISAYEIMGTGEFYDSKFDEVIAQEEKWYRPGYVRFSEDGGRYGEWGVESLQPYRDWWDSDDRLIEFFKYMLQANYRLPTAGLEDDFDELAYTLFAFYVFYSEIAPYLLGDHVDLYQQEMAKFLKLFLVIDNNLTKTVKLVGEYLDKIIWRDSVTKHRHPRTVKKRRYGEDQYGKILKEIWDNLSDRDRSKEQKPYTLARRMKEIWKQKYPGDSPGKPREKPPGEPPQDLKTIVRYINDFKEWEKPNFYYVDTGEKI